MTQSPATAPEEPLVFKSGLQPWAPPPIETVLAAIEHAQQGEEEAPFVFHDPAGRRWSRIKRVALVGAAALVVVGGGVTLAVTRLAPGRAPALAGSPFQSVPNWQVRDPSAGSPSGTAPTANPFPTMRGAPGTRSGPTAQTSPTATPRPSPSPTRRPKPTPTPRHSPTPKP